MPTDSYSDNGLAVTIQRPSYTEVTLDGLIGGAIWMPCEICSKHFSLNRDKDFRFSDGSLPTLREMAIEAICDGDFRGASIADATVTFRRTRVTSHGERITRTRTMDIRKFPSVSDYVLEHDSEAYWEVIDSGMGDADED